MITVLVKTLIDMSAGPEDGRLWRRSEDVATTDVGRITEQMTSSKGSSPEVGKNVLLVHGGGEAGPGHGESQGGGGSVDGLHAGQAGHGDVTLREWTADPSDGDRNTRNGNHIRGSLENNIRVHGSLGESTDIAVRALGLWKRTARSEEEPPFAVHLVIVWIGAVVTKVITDSTGSVGEPAVLEPIIIVVVGTGGRARAGGDIVGEVILGSQETGPLAEHLHLGDAAGSLVLVRATSRAPEVIVELIQAEISGSNVLPSVADLGIDALLGVAVPPAPVRNRSPAVQDAAVVVEDTLGRISGARRSDGDDSN